MDFLVIEPLPLAECLGHSYDINFTQEGNSLYQTFPMPLNSYQIFTH